MKVLLLEDQVVLQKCTSRLIRHTLGDNTSVDITDSVPTTIALLQHAVYDLIVSDFDVICGTGGDVLTWVREFQPHMVTRFVFFTGSHEAWELHDKVISKGISVDEFKEQLRAHLASGVAA